MRGLLAPLPRRAWLVLAALALPLFAVAWLAFTYPLSYCDSPGWAPTYLADVIGTKLPHAASPRGWPATAYLGALGAVATRFYWPAFIGFVQGIVLLVAMIRLVRVPLASATRVTLVLLPAFVAAALRHAIYSQTLLSEPLAILLVALLVPPLVDGTFGVGRGVLWGAVAAILVSIRLDLAYLAPLLLVRPLFGSTPRATRLRAIGGVAAGLALTLAIVAGVQQVVGRDPDPVGPRMTLAEWMPVTAPARNGFARTLRTPLADSLAAAQARGRFRTAIDALPDARRLAKGPDAGWGGVARVLVYDLANDPGAVLAQRLGVLADTWATSYAAFWPDYRPRSPYYSRYAAVFSQWSIGEIDEGNYSSCVLLADYQRHYFSATGVAHAGLAQLLLQLHRGMTPFAVFVTRPLVWLALPALVVVLVRRRVTATTGWLAVLFAAHFLLRALLVPADERYELPVDVLLLGWVGLVLADAIRAFVPEQGSTGNASSPRR